MSDLLSQQLGTGQSAQMPYPATIASTTTIAPTTRMSFVSGTISVGTITPFTTGYCEIVLTFTNASPGVFVTTGNVLTAYQPVQNRPIMLCYDPASAKWYVQSVT